MNFRLLGCIQFVIILFCSCKGTYDSTTNTGSSPPKNLILLIGDGMGLSQVSSAFYFQDQEPNFKRFQTVGLMKTSSKKEKVTDSASSATAIACGVKTDNRTISVDENGNPIETLIERISKLDISSGLVVTSSVTHATPAAFYAHVTDRSMEEEIADQMMSSNVDYAAGGGLRFFTERSDGRNLLEEDTGRSIFLLADDGMPSKIAGREDFLPEYTVSAIEHLSQRSNGFFLLVEGSQIDWAGHDADAKGVALETIDFDKAIGEALNFAEKDGNTLVVVTADHETGGYAIIPKDDGNGWDYSDVAGAFYQDGRKYGSTAHTATLVPVFAFGPGAKLFSGIYDIDEIHEKMIHAMNW